MGAYVSVAERRRRNAEASQREINRRQMFERESTRIGQPGVSDRDILRASEINASVRSRRGR